MTTSNRAKRATVAIGPSQVDAFQMPDGSYCMSQAQVAECIGTTPQNASNFLRSKAFKALRGGGSTDQSFETMADLAVLGEAYAEPDALREQVAQLEQQLRDAGLEPWQLPQTER